MNAPNDEAAPCQPTAILAIILVSYFMILLDNSIIFTALPTIHTAMHDLLSDWAKRTSPQAGERVHASLRFAFYGRVSTEDWQDPVTSRARQQDQTSALVAGHGTIVAEFFDAGESRTLAWARRPQAAALVAALADPDRGVGRDRDRRVRARLPRRPVRLDGTVVPALRHPAVDAGGRRSSRKRRGS